MSAESEAKSSNILLWEHFKLVDELRARYRALQYQVKETYKTQKGELKGVTDGTKSQEKATQAVTETLKKQADVVDKNKQKLEEMMKREKRNLQQIKSKVGAVTGAISAIGGPPVTGAVGAPGCGLATTSLPVPEQASLESAQSSLQGAFAPITTAVLPLAHTFAQTISGLAQTVAPLLSGVLGRHQLNDRGNAFRCGSERSGHAAHRRAGRHSWSVLQAGAGHRHMDAGAGPFRSGGQLRRSGGGHRAGGCKPFANAVQLAKKHEKKHTEKGMGEVGRIRRKEMMPMGAAA